MENTLKQSSPPTDTTQIYRDICDLSSDPMVVLDRSYRCVYANQAYLNILHLTGEQVLNRSIKEVEGPAAFKLIKPRIDRCFAGEQVSHRTQVYLANPTYSLLQVSLRPYRSANNEVTHAIVIMRQPGSHLQTDPESAFNQSQLSKSLASSPQPVIITALTNGEILQFNQAGLALLGYSHKELAGKQMCDYVVDPSYRDNLIEKLQQNSQCKIDDLPIRHKNGSVVHIEVVLNLTTFSGIPAILGFCRDRTDELLALQAANDKANTLHLLRTVAVAANEAVDIESALKVCLEEVCRYSGWPIGHALMMNSDEEMLESSGVWISTGGESHHAFVELTGNYRFAGGEGLPGRVLQSGNVVSIPDIAEDDNFPRAELEVYRTVKSAFAFPVLTGDKVAAVLEFFSPQAGAVSDSLLEVLKPVGVQLGRIIERQDAEHSLRASKEHYQRLLDDIDAIVWEAELPKLGFNFVSACVEKMLGYPREKWHSPEFWAEHIHPEDREKTLSLCMAYTEARQDHELEYRMIAKDGAVLWFKDVVKVIRGSDGKPSKLRGVMFDISVHKHLSEKLAYQASHDNLTSLYNRDVFEYRLNELLASDLNQRRHALCYLDLDQFKVINDACGHLAGDMLLRQLSGLLSTRLREKDTLARLGGDEFGILLEDCSIDQAYKTAEKIRKLIQDFRFIWRNRRYNIGVSIGLTAIDQHSGTFKEILSAVDMACYAAKDAGRNRIRVYHPDDQELADRRREMDWVAKINSALEENRFRLYIQPIRALQGSPQGAHYEVLLRMIGRDGQAIAPGAFLPAAERYGLSTKLDRWVIKQTLGWLDKYPRALNDLSLCSINLSGLSLDNATFLTFLLDTLRNSRVSYEKICFEVTETAAISKLTHAKAFIETLKEAGCKIALDDFGSGLSSFNYLKNLPVDFLKIDGSFVVDIARDPIDYEMVRSINEIGHIMGKKTIAEFVEDEATLKALETLGVDYAQGYHIGRPIPLAPREQYTCRPYKRY